MIKQFSMVLILFCCMTIIGSAMAVEVTQLNRKFLVYCYENKKGDNPRCWIESGPDIDDGVLILSVEASVDVLLIMQWQLRTITKRGSQITMQETLDAFHESCSAAADLYNAKRELLEGLVQAFHKSIERK